MTAIEGLRRRAWTVVGIVLLASTVASTGGAPADLPVMDGLPTATPEEVGVSSERLERLERLDRAIQAYVERQEVAGVVSLVARRGKVVHFSTFGQANGRLGHRCDPTRFSASRR